MPVTYANQAAFVAALAKLVPDMKGAYTEADFVTEAVDALSEDQPGWETVDVGDGSTLAWRLGLAAAPFASFVIGFSDLWPLEVEVLDAAGAPYRPPAIYTPAPYFEKRYASATPELWLVFETAPSATGKARVRFAKPWTVSATAVDVPARWHAAVVKKAAAKKCAALSTFYKESIDPAGGSDIFDARQYAESYAADAERWDAEYAKLVGIGGGEVAIEHGPIQRGAPTAFRPWGGPTRNPSWVGGGD